MNRPDLFDLGRRAAPERQSRADGITIRFPAIADQPDRDEAALRLMVVLQEPDPGRGAVRDPHVRVAIPIPIDDADRTRVIVKIDTEQSADINKARAFQIQEERIALIAAERLPLGKSAD
jgi:hypothetical protein